MGAGHPPKSIADLLHRHSLLHCVSLLVQTKQFLKVKMLGHSFRRFQGIPSTSIGAQAVSTSLGSKAPAFRLTKPVLTDIYTNRKASLPK